MFNKEEKLLVAYIKAKFYCKVKKLKFSHGETNYILLRLWGIGYDGDSWIPACNILFKTLADIVDYLEIENAEYKDSSARTAACNEFLVKLIMAR